MKTYKQLKDFCETKNVRHEVNPMYSKPYEYMSVEDGKVVWKDAALANEFEYFRRETQTSSQIRGTIIESQIIELPNTR